MKTKRRNDARGNGRWQGSKWCRPATRLAIYLRDGLACCWCGHAVEDGAKLSLDHVVPHSHGGDNNPRNLVTTCERCNKSRGARSAKEFAAAVAKYVNHEIKPRDVTRHVTDCQSRDLATHRVEAREMLARRGTVARVLADL